MAAVTGGGAADERRATDKPARGSLMLQIAILLIGIFVIAHNAAALWQPSDGGSSSQRLGWKGDFPGSNGFCKIAAVTAGGPMAVAGAHKGDFVRPDRGIDFKRTLRTGEPVGVTLRRGGALTHVILKAGPQSASAIRSAAFSRTLVVVTQVLVCLIGMFVTLRGRRLGSTLLFGAALVCLGLLSNFATPPESDPSLYPAVESLLLAVYNAPPVLFLAFALAARREAGARPSHLWDAVFVANAAATAISVGYLLWVMFTCRTLIDFRTGFALAGAFKFLSYGLAVLALGLAWRESRGRDRTRFAFMLTAVGLLVCVQLFGGAIYATSKDFSPNNPLFWPMVIAPAVGAVVFAYAVLRHRVLDVGFALNRTLVYGAVSAILLAVFGLIEWAVDHFAPIAGREKNALVDAVIAVGVFLTFHRVRDVVERGVEGLFFRRWHEAEAALRRFVREAAFITETAALTQAFAKALGDYAEGAQSAVFLAEGRRYHRAAGEVAGVGAQLDPDLAALVRLRADLKPVEVDDGVLAASLIAPMVNRNEVIGAVVLGPKASGLSYRPDEIELIGWASRQVGLDLHALEVEGLRAERGRLQNSVTALERVLALRTETA
jgi:hypothetical protein